MSTQNVPDPVADDRHARRYYRRRRVLVIGADGFLGLNFVRALAQLQSTVSILTRSADSRARAFAQNVYRGDLRDKALVRTAVQDQDLIIDLAGSCGAVDSNKHPENSLEEDCKPHLNLFVACAAMRVSPMVIFASSRLVYGRPQYLPVNEGHPLSPLSMYAVHKITVENYLQVMAQTEGLRHCIFRLSNPYGPSQPDNGKGYGIINHFLRAAARGEQIVIYGNGSQVRDYIYVDDVVSAFLLAATEDKCCNRTLNLGGVAPVSLADAAREISEIAGGTPVRFEPWPQDARMVETGDYCTDSSLLRSLVRIPIATPWKIGLATSMNYYREEASATATRPMRAYWQAVS